MGYSPQARKESDMSRTSLLPLLFDSRENQGLGKVSGVVEGKTRARIFPPPTSQPRCFLTACSASPSSPSGSICQE